MKPRSWKHVEYFTCSLFDEAEGQTTPKILNIPLKRNREFHSRVDHSDQEFHSRIDNSDQIKEFHFKWKTHKAPPDVLQWYLGEHILDQSVWMSIVDKYLKKT
jgi:hypothetical protein